MQRMLELALVILYGIGIFSFGVEYSYTNREAKHIVKYHNSFDKSFVNYSRRVEELSSKYAPSSPDFGEKVYGVWLDEDLSNKFRRYERYVREKGIQAVGRK